MTAVQVRTSGLSVVYTPSGSEPVVDIVFVHGLQGHPRNTWTSDPRISNRQSRTSVTPASDKSTKRRLLEWVSNFSKPGHKSSPATEQQQNYKDPVDTSQEKIFWPSDLLPVDCPNARILTYGYDTSVTHGFSQSSSKVRLYGHGKALLHDLSRQQAPNRPIIFVAHSLGGIIVKEALIMSHRHRDSEPQAQVLKGTSAILFLGTPHFGSEDMASMGEKGRKIASALFMDTSSAILDSLRLDNDDLERCNDAFLTVWEECKFKVKTFQESKPLFSVNLGPLNQLVVPPTCSRLNHPNEDNEPLEADHRQLVKFTGRDDDNYRKVGGELKAIYENIVQSKKGGWPGSFEKWSEQRALERKIEDLREALRFPEMDVRQQTIEDPMEHTCEWFLRSSEYNSWISHTEEPHEAFLWVKGSPGAGKSTLIKFAARHTAQRLPKPGHRVASFFFRADATSPLERNRLGLFQSLIRQLLPDSTVRWLQLYDSFQTRKLKGIEQLWDLNELSNVFESMFTEKREDSTYIFIDAVDECENRSETSQRDLVRFLRNVTVKASLAGARLRICISSRSNLTVTDPAVLAKPFSSEIAVEYCNSQDIELYARNKLLPSESGQKASYDSDWVSLKNALVEKASGVFLWVVLTINVLQNDWDDGKDIASLWARLNQVPRRLEDAYAKLFEEVDAGEANVIYRLFQWTLFSERLLRLSEWHHIMAFIGNPSLKSFKEWKESSEVTKNDDQLAKRITKLSRGLLRAREYQFFSLDQPNHSKSTSTLAGAGSFDGSKCVMVIHETVREFFLGGDGFSRLNPHITNPTADGHLLILNTLINYSFVAEMGALRRRRRASSREISPRGPKCPPDTLPSEWNEVNGWDQEYLDRLALEHAREIEELKSSQRRRITKLPETVTTPFGSSAPHYARSTPSSASSWNHSLRDELEPPMKERESPDLTSSVGPSQPSSFVSRKSMTTAETIQHYVESTKMEAQQDAELSNDQPTHDPEPVRSVASSYRVFPEPEILVLWGYFQDMLVSHATSLQAEGADPAPMLENLVQRGWTLFSELRDDISDGATMLYFAAERNLWTWIPWLSDVSQHGVNQPGGALQFPLIVAANKENSKVVEELLMKGADISVQDKLGRSAIHHAAASKSPAMLELICRNSRVTRTDMQRAMRLKDAWGQTALHLAAYQGSAEVVAFLIEQGADIDAKDNVGDSPLHFACDREVLDFNVVRELIRGGANMKVKNENSEEPILLVFKNGGVEAALQLFKAVDAWRKQKVV